MFHHPPQYEDCHLASRSLIKRILFLSLIYPISILAGWLFRGHSESPRVAAISRPKGNQPTSLLHRTYSRTKPLLPSPISDLLPTMFSEWISGPNQPSEWNITPTRKLAFGSILAKIGTLLRNNVPPSALQPAEYDLLTPYDPSYKDYPPHTSCLLTMEQFMGPNGTLRSRSVIEREKKRANARKENNALRYVASGEGYIKTWHCWMCHSSCAFLDSPSFATRRKNHLHCRQKRDNQSLLGLRMKAVAGMELQSNFYASLSQYS